MPLRSSLTVPELVHCVALSALSGPVGIRQRVQRAYEAAGHSRTVAEQRGRSMAPLVAEAIDEYARLNQIRGIQTYLQRDPANRARAVTNPRCGPFKWTAPVQDLLMELHWRDFEILVGNLARIYDCSEVAITRGANDGGVDFVGKLPFEGTRRGRRFRTAPPVAAGTYAYVIGQAKRHDLHNPVENSVYDQLVGKIVALPGGGLRALNDLGLWLRAWGWVPRSPCLACVATTSRFRGNFRGYIRKQAGLGIDGEQLAQRVIDRSYGADDVTKFEAVIGSLASSAARGVRVLD
jgi:hypothetical protein